MRFILSRFGLYGMRVAIIIIKYNNINTLLPIGYSNIVKVTGRRLIRYK